MSDQPQTPNPFSDDMTARLRIADEIRDVAEEAFDLGKDLGRYLDELSSEETEGLDDCIKSLLSTILGGVEPTIDEIDRACGR